MSLVTAMQILCGYLENHPEIPVVTDYWGTGVNVSVWDSGGGLDYTVSYREADEGQISTVDAMRNVVRAVKGDWSKNYSDYSFKYTKTLSYEGGDIRIILSTSRENACAKVQVGTETKMVPDPSVKMVEVEVPKYEWECK